MRVKSFVRGGVWGGCLALVVGVACSEGDSAAPSTTTSENQPSPAASGSGNAAPPTPVANGTPPADNASPPAPSAPGASEAPVEATPPGAAMAPAMAGPVAPAAPVTPVAPAPSFEGEACSGCARFSVPMTAGNQFGMFELNLPAPVDMTATTITWRVMAVGFTGTSGGVAPYVRDAQNRDQCFIWTNLSALGAWTNVTCEFSQRFAGGSMAPNNAFDRTTVAKIGLQIHSGGVAANATYSNALVYLDSVTFSNGVSPDITFDASIGDLAFLPADSAGPDGTSVDFLGE
jgi:hypothetical protein